MQPENESETVKKELKTLLEKIKRLRGADVKVVLDNRKGRKRELYIKTAEEDYFVQLETDCMLKKKTILVKKNKEAVFTDKIDEETLELIDKLTKTLDEEIEKRGKIKNIDTSNLAVIKYEAHID